MKSTCRLSSKPEKLPQNRSFCIFIRILNDFNLKITKKFPQKRRGTGEVTEKVFTHNTVSLSHLFYFLSFLFKPYTQQQQQQQQRAGKNILHDDGDEEIYKMRAEKK